MKLFDEIKNINKALPTANFEAILSTSYSRLVKYYALVYLQKNCLDPDQRKSIYNAINKLKDVPSQTFDVEASEVFLCLKRFLYEVSYKDSESFNVLLNLFADLYSDTRSGKKANHFEKRPNWDFEKSQGAYHIESYTIVLDKNAYVHSHYRLNIFNDLRHASRSSFKI